MQQIPEITLAGERAAPPDMSAGSVFFIGNATVLQRFAGFTILTDPTFIHMHEQTWLGYDTLANEHESRGQAAADGSAP